MVLLYYFTYIDDARSNTNQVYRECCFIAGHVASSIALQPRFSPLYREEARDNTFSSIITVLIAITIMYLVQF